MPNILSSTSLSGATAAQGRSAAGESGPAARQAPIGLHFGAHLGRKPQAGATAELARSSADPKSSSPTSQGESMSAGDATRARQSGAEADDDDKPRFRFRDVAGVTTGEVGDPLDPMARVLFASGLRPGGVAPAAAPHDDSLVRSSRVSMEHVLTRLVRRIAWSGDAESGSARLELGAGALEGATLTIHSDQGQVRVSLELPPGVDGAKWKERIARRLGARGLQVAAIEVE